MGIGKLVDCKKAGRELTLAGVGRPNGLAAYWSRGVLTCPANESVCPPPSLVLAWRGAGMVRRKRVGRSVEKRGHMSEVKL